MKTVRVHPLRAFPKKASEFDYFDPTDSLAAGDLVTVPFRNRVELAIVSDQIPAEDGKAVKSVNELLKQSAITSTQLSFLKSIAQTFDCSLTALIRLSFSTLKPNKLSKTNQKGATSFKKYDVDRARIIIEQAASKKTVPAQSDLTFAITFCVVLGKALGNKKQIKVITPLSTQAEIIATALGSGALKVAGKQTAQTKADELNAWRRGEFQFLVGTRAISLWESDDLGAIVLVNAGDDELAETRRNPHFDSREVAKLEGSQRSIPVFWFDPLPPLALLDLEQTGEPNNYLDLPMPNLIYLRAQEESTGEPLLSASLINEINEALLKNTKVLIFANRKGVAERLQCSACKYTPICGNCGGSPIIRAEDLLCPHCRAEMWVPEACPGCGKKKLKFSGVGTQKIESLLKNHFPAARFSGVEKGGEIDLSGDIIIVTQYFFSGPIDQTTLPKFGLIADLLIDVGLNSPTYLASELVARHLAQMRLLAWRQGARYLVQTLLPEAIQPMIDQTTFITAELNLRKKYHLPPYVT